MVGDILTFSHSKWFGNEFGINPQSPSEGTSLNPIATPLSYNKSSTQKLVTLQTFIWANLLKKKEKRKRCTIVLDIYVYLKKNIIIIIILKRVKRS